MAITTIHDINELIETFPETQKNQTLNTIYQYLMDMKQSFQPEKTVMAPTKKADVSMAGFLADYANPSLVEQEKTAWQQAMVDKYATH